VKCEDFIRLIDAYIDGELDQDTMSEMLTHAQECEECAREFEAAQLLRETLRGIDDDIVPPLAAQAAWRNSIKAEARRKRMNRIYKFCASAAAAVVLMVGVYAGIDAFDKNNAPQRAATVSEADAGFVFVAADGGDATPDPGSMARMTSLTMGDEVAGSTASVKLTAEDPSAACESVISIAEEFYGYTEAQGGSDTNVYLTAYIPADSIDQFVESLGLVGEVTGWQFNDSGSANVTVTITIKTAD